MNDELKDKLGDLKEDAGQLFSAIKDVVADKADDLKDDAKDIFADLKENGTQVFNEAKDYVSGKIDTIKKEGFSDNVKAELKEEILDPASKALKEAKEKVEDMFAKDGKDNNEPIEVDIANNTNTEE